jgi:hypothetical protein
MYLSVSEQGADRRDRPAALRDRRSPGRPAESPPPPLLLPLPMSLLYTPSGRGVSVARWGFGAPAGPETRPERRAYY